MYESFRAHIDGASYGGVLEKLIGPYTEPKISNFVRSLGLQYIRCFDIPMNNLLIRQILQSLKHIPDNLSKIVSIQLSPPSEQALKIPPLTELSNNVAVVGTGVHIHAFHNMGVAHYPEYAYLAL